MKVLVIGSGGREHALAWKLSAEGWDVLVAPGNAGMARHFAVGDSSANDRMRLLELCKSYDPSLVLIGPEDPLISGLADMFRENGFSTFGPGVEASRLEGSKSFSKDMMKRAGVPTADYQSFSNSDLAKEYVRSRFSMGQQVAVKASGAALGKGVVVCESEGEAIEAVSMMMDSGGLGEAGRTVVIEDRLIGREFSLLTLVSDQGMMSLPVAQDYKRVFEGDLGANTGGMGAYSPVDWLDSGVVAGVEEEVVRPITRLFEDLGISYRGVLFSGLMVGEDGAKCLEYNVRFGDPETQTVMRRLGAGFGDALMAVANGGAIPPLQVLDNASVTVVCASEGYPGHYQKGAAITIGDMPDEVEVFFAGVGEEDGGLITNGGRVLSVSATGSTVESARSRAYEGVGQIQFDGLHVRRDIASESSFVR